MWCTCKYHKRSGKRMLKIAYRVLLVQWLGLSAFTAVAQVRSLVVRELRLCKPCGPAKKKNKIAYRRLGRTSLVAQWLRIHLPMQGTQLWALVREDPTWRGATKPVCHNYWACALEPASHNYWACVLQLLKPTRLEPVLRNKTSHRNEKPAHRNKE